MTYDDIVPITKNALEGTQAPDESQLDVVPDIFVFESSAPPDNPSSEDLCIKDILDFVIDKVFKINAQHLGRLDYLFNKLYKDNSIDETLSNLDALLIKNPGMLYKLEEKVDLSSQDREHESDGDYIKRIKSSIKALEVLHKQGYDFGREKLYDLMLIAKTKGNLQKLATRLLIQHGEEQSLLEFL